MSEHCPLCSCQCDCHFPERRQRKEREEEQERIREFLASPEGKECLAELRKALENDTVQED